MTLCGLAVCFRADVEAEGGLYARPERLKEGSGDDMDSRDSSPRVTRGRGYLLNFNLQLMCVNALKDGCALCAGELSPINGPT